MEIAILIARIILLILSGMSSVGAVEEVAKASGVAKQHCGVIYLIGSSRA